MQWMMVLVVLIWSISAAAAIKMDEVPYEVGGVRMEGTLVYDDAATPGRPGVVVFPEWWGANDYAKGRARMLVEAGYVAFVADMYGGGKTTEDPKEAGSLAQGVYGQPGVMVDRAKAAVAKFRASGKADAKRIAAIGYCMGGSVALNLAYSGEEITAVVAFHAGLAKRVQEMGQIKAKILVLNGGADKMVSPQETQEFAQTMLDAKADWQLVLFGKAMHSFTNPNADKHRNLGTLGYDAEADRRSWQYMMMHLESTIGQAK